MDDGADVFFVVLIAVRNFIMPNGLYKYLVGICVRIFMYVDKYKVQKTGKKVPYKNIMLVCAQLFQVLQAFKISTGE